MSWKWPGRATGCKSLGATGCEHHCGWDASQSTCLVYETQGPFLALQNAYVRDALYQGTAPLNFRGHTLPRSSGVLFPRSPNSALYLERSVILCQRPWGLQCHSGIVCVEPS